MSVETATRCVRCYAPLSEAPHLMAGRSYCCASCSVGSACEHQGTHRPVNVRRYDTMFDRFRHDVRRSTAFEVDLPAEDAAH